MSNQEHPLSFLVPTVTAKVYIVKGPSGWVETFDRRKLDGELAIFAAPVKVDTLVQMFVAARKVSEDRGPTDWWTVIGYLARLKSCHPKDIPHTIAIAFWGQVVTSMASADFN